MRRRLARLKAGCQAEKGRCKIVVAEQLRVLVAWTGDTIRG